MKYYLILGKHTLITLMAFLLLSNGAIATAQTEPNSGPDITLLKQSRQKAINFLKTAQADDGSWTSPMAPGITALVTTALLKSGVSANDPVVEKAINHLIGYQQPDGGIYFGKSKHRNYETCITLMALKEANQNGKYDATLKKAEGFLRGLQWDKGEGLETSDAGFGGAGYGSHQRPDLSNTQYLLEALKAAGVKSDDPAMQKALVFISRCQNLESEHNTTSFAAKIDDGGFYYTPAAGGTSQAGVDDNGGLRSYGSMTYAGLKSMIYAGLTTDDKRVQAALKWIRKNYTLETNPGLGQQGLYYYYHTFAKALGTLNMKTFEDAKGVQHDWRKELTTALAEQQKPNGSWVNKAARWYEGDPNLATAYALLALSYCD